MQKKWNNILKNVIFSGLVLLFFFFISLGIHIVFDSRTLIPSLFVLAVFLISMFTSGYVYGTVAALISVLAVNYAFTFPYFAFNFRLHENILSAVILLCVTTATSTLTTRVRTHDKALLRAEKEKMRADLLRAVSHDLRTPLTTIYGASATVIDNYHALSDAQKLDIISDIRKDSRWLIRMVENLLSVTKLDTSQVNLQKSPVVLEELIDSVLAKFKKSFPDCPVRLLIPEEFLMVSADGLLIEQVLLNLLENAVQHAEGMQTLSLSVRTESTYAVFEVTDDGCGMPPEKLKHIFSGYHLADTALPDSRKRSMGIGLSVCAAIIRAHGSEIYAENLRKGGMRFFFTLTLEEASE